jgi:hypothetical protein
MQLIARATDQLLYLDQSWSKFSEADNETTIDLQTDSARLSLTLAIAWSQGFLGEE